MTRSLAASLSTFLFLGACATLDEGPYKYADDWHPGQVSEIGQAADLKRWASRDCRKELDSEQLRSRDFVNVAYRHNGMLRYRIVPIPEKTSFQAEERVYVNLTKCTEAIAKRSQK